MGNNGGVSGLIVALITGGLGAALGSIGTALVQSVSKKGESRAIAADRVTAAAGNLADRMDRMNTNLEKENAAMRRAMVALTEVVDELIPLIPDPGEQARARKAVSAARLALR